MLRLRLPKSILTLGRTRKVIPHRWYKGGLMDPPWFFDMLQYVGTILPSVESLTYDLLYKMRYIL